MSEPFRPYEKLVEITLLGKKFQVPIGPNASRMGAGEIRMTPLKGVYIAMMMKIAAETAIAQATSVTITE